MTQPAGARDDRDVLAHLNADYIASDQNSDVARYDQILAEDYTATLPDLVFRNRQQFLDLIAQPRPFTDLQAHDVPDPDTRRFRADPRARHLYHARRRQARSPLHR